MGQAAPIRGLISHKQMAPVRTVLIIISTVLQLTTPDPLFQIRKKKMERVEILVAAALNPKSGIILIFTALQNSVFIVLISLDWAIQLRKIGH